MAASRTLVAKATLIIAADLLATLVASLLVTLVVGLLVSLVVIHVATLAVAAKNIISIINTINAKNIVAPVIQ